MKISFSDAARQAPEDYAELSKTTSMLEDVLGASADLVSGKWDRKEDAKGRPVYTLQLSDWSGAVTGVFAPAELKQTSQLRMRFNRLWGDLLQIRSHKQLEELLQKNT
ncbi:MAG: hypothetical protein U0793_15935 [Gemmataceae bacterium]